MKLKYFLMAGLGLMVSGGLLAGTTYAFGTHRSLAWENGPQLVEMNHDSQVISTKEKINKIVVNAQYQQVEIKRGKNFEVNSTYEKATKPQVTTKGDTLTINGNGREQNVLFHVMNNTSKITLTVPSELPLDQLVLEGEQGQLLLNDVVSENVSVTNNGGYITFNKVDGNKVKVNSVQSYVNIDNSDISNIELNAKYGNLFLNGFKNTQGTVMLENCYVDFLDNGEIGLDIDLLGMSTVTKNNEELPIKTVIKGENNIKITGYDSSVVIADENHQYDV